MFNRRVILWAIAFLLLMAGIGGYTVLRTWERRDAILLEGIKAEVAKKAPDWNVGIEEAELVNMQGRVRIGGFTIKPRGETIPILEIPECFITIDPDLLLKEHQIRVRKLTLSHPTVTLIRHTDGTWNWQKLGRPKPSEQTPEIQVESGSFVIRVEAAAGLPETEIANRDMALQLLPAGLHRYLIQGASQIDGAGGLNFSGRIDLNSGAWELAGSADGLDMSPALLEKAAALSPAVKRRVAELSEPRTTVIPGAQPLSMAPSKTPLIRQTSQIETTPVATELPSSRRGASQLSLPHLGLIADVAVDFELRSDGEQTIPDYRLVAKVMEGQVAEPLSPVPLYGLEGELLLENDRIVIRRVSAENGESQLYLDGEVSQQDGKASKKFNVKATNLWLDPQVRSLLPPEKRKLFDLINPSGRFSITARYDSEADKPLKLDKLTAHDCAIRHELFPYPIENIAGTIDQQDERLTIALKGEAADRPVQIDGEVIGSGSEAETVVHLQVDQFPIDERIPESLVSPEHEAARKAIEALNLSGVAELKLQFARPSGEDQKFRMSFDADVSQARLSFRGFPYPIDELSGHVHYDPWKDRVWRFTDLQGRHGPATLSGNATYDLTNRPGNLNLTINAENAPLDKELRYASEIANPEMATIWEELNPAGVIHVNGLQVDWTPDTPPQVVIPTIRLENGSIVPRSFPYRWEDVTAEIGWKNGRVDVRRAAGRHRQTTLLIEGRRKEEPAYFELMEDQLHKWELELPVITVHHLDPRGEFLDALPEEAAAVLRKLNPEGPLDGELWMQMRGWPDEEKGELVTSAWRLNVNLNQDRLSAGLDFSNVTGRVESVIRCSPDRVTVDGVVHFQHARALDTTFTNIRGPFSFVGDELTIGSASVLRGLKAPPDEQLTASVYGGAITVNSIGQLDTNDPEQSTYQALIDVENAELSQWAKEWGASKYNVAGTVNGRMNLRGQGSSPMGLAGENCWIQVTDARLGELPQFAQLLGQVTGLQQPDKTAFRYAYAEFSVAHGVFEFGSSISQSPGDTRRIIFDGDMLKMVGRGTIPFAEGIDPRMDLRFLSKVAERNRLLPNIPIISPILNSTMDNWIRLRVTGTPNRPQIEVMPQLPIGNVNDVLREIFTTPLPIVR